MPVSCVILGGGGHASVLIDCLLESPDVTLWGILDNARGKWGENIFGVPVVGGDEHLTALKTRGVTHFVVGLGSAGNNAPRERLFRQALSQGLMPFSVRHRSAIGSPRATLGAGTQLLPGAIVNAGAVLGVNVLLNTGCIVEHDCVIGDHVHVASGARLAGAVRVGPGAHIGAGATVKQGIQIGPQAVVGAGAAVVCDVAAGSVVVGVPARELRRAA